MFSKAGFRIMLSFIICLIVQLYNMPGADAQGNLTIMPRRVIFEGAKRIQELNLANSGIDTAKYLVSVIQYRMLENGNFEQVETPDSGQNFADKNFRFFPRSIVLGPNESQTIKIQTINTSGLQPGEYRSHLYFRGVPNEKNTPKDTLKSETSVSVHLVPVLGIAIPVIIRVGVPQVHVMLDKPVLEIVQNSQPKIHLNFLRSGNSSTYGDIKINYISEQGKVTRVGFAKGFAIYTPNLNRRLTLNLDTKVIYSNGKLQVVYSTPSDAKSLIMAETSINLL